MSEEIESKAIEISDEEMGNISGGMATVVCDEGDNRDIYRCIHPKMHGENFKKSLFDNNYVCKRFLSKWSKTDQWYHATGNCHSGCEYYKYANTDPTVVRVSPETYRGVGDFIYIQK